MWIVAIWSFCWTLRMKRMVSQGDIRIQDLRQLGHRFTRGCSRINVASNAVRFNRSAPGIWKSVSTCGSAALGIQSCLTMYIHTRVYIYIYIHNYTILYILFIFIHATSNDRWSNLIQSVAAANLFHPVPLSQLQADSIAFSAGHVPWALANLARLCGKYNQWRPTQYDSIDQNGERFCFFVIATSFKSFLFFAIAELWLAYDLHRTCIWLAYDAFLPR